MLEDYGIFISAEELYEILPVGKNSVYRLLKTGEIKNKKCGGKYLVLKQDLLNYLGITETGESANDL